MANRDIKKEKKKPKGGPSSIASVLKPPMPQPEVIRKEKNEK